MSQETQDAVKGTNVVTMKDGRQVDFGVRGKLKKTITNTETGVKVSVDVINGDTYELEIPLDHALVKEILGYGISQKVTDTVVKAEEGDDIALGVERIITQLKDGIWSSRVSADNGIRGFSDLVEAIRRVRGYEVDSEQHKTLKASLTAKSEEELKALKTNDIVKGVIAQITAEKAAARAAKLSSVSGDASSSDVLVGL